MAPQSVQSAAAVPLTQAKILFAVLVHCATSYAWHLGQRVFEPYLDEVFHVGQSQAYCRGEFGYWDDKITTPPGLYLLSYVVFRLTGRCDLAVHRYLNACLICLIAVVASSLRTTIAFSRRKRYTLTDLRSIVQVAGRVAINTAFFPPLFFFCALYYTDIASTLVVLASIYSSIRWHNSSFADVKWLVVALVTGLYSLLCRQTNIFWVAVFPAGLAIVRFLRSSGLNSARLKSSARFPDVVTASWKRLEIYDVPVNEAYLEDYVKTVLSIAIAAVSCLHQVVWIVAPYAALIGAFGAFVLWNGGVVLGDKSNHVATIHIPQMLYIWPYFLFFSWPLILQDLYSLWVAHSKSNEFNPSATRGRIQWSLPRIWVLSLFTALAAAAVHFNTIVHPFTLADNRHYVFYVFRYLLRFPSVKYLATPIYVLGGWLVIRVLGVPPSARNAEGSQRPDVQKPSQVQPALPEDSNNTSFVIVWLATTALTLISAPLVEPRYYILPWMMWRLHVPASYLGSSSDAAASQEKNISQAKGGTRETTATSKGHNRAVQYGLGAEMAWFLLVNWMTVHIFLNWGFAWPQEPGKVQRFMW